ncbi:MAG: DUF4363 family protein [Ruminococcaceae bacterium]|nr:DUF4363 family protein [Oscillospiraceae bacterium]
MKRIIAAIILCIFVVSVLIVGNIVINNQCDGLKKDINELKSDIFSDKTEEANQKIKNINDLWESRKTVMSIFSNHSPLDNITIALSELTLAIEVNDKNISLVKCGEISALISRITEEQRIHAESFF